MYCNSVSGSFGPGFELILVQLTPRRFIITYSKNRKCGPSNKVTYCIEYVLLCENLCATFKQMSKLKVSLEGPKKLTEI